MLNNFFGWFPLEAGVTILGFYGIIKSGNCPYLNNVDHETLSLDDFPGLTIGLAILFYTINIMLSSMLIIGTVKRKHLYFAPWLMFKFFGVFSYGCSALMALVESHLIISAAYIVVFAFNLYLWLTVLSLFYRLKKLYHQEQYQFEINEISPYLRAQN